MLLLALLLLAQSDFFLPLFDVLLVNQVGPLQQEVRKVVNGIFRNLLAKLNKSFSQVRNHIVHQVLADWLRALVKQVALLFANLLKFGSHSIFFDFLLFGGFGLFCSSFLGLLLLSMELLLFFPYQEVDFVQIFVLELLIRCVLRGYFVVLRFTFRRSLFVGVLCFCCF